MDNGQQPTRALGEGLRELVDYEILKEIDRSTHHVTWLAQRKGVGKPLLLTMILGKESVALREQLRFRREGEQWAALRHSSVISPIETGLMEGHPCLVREHVEGTTLEEKLREGPRPPTVAARLVEKLAQAARALHHKELSLGDLTPANVLMDKDGEPRLVNCELPRLIRLANPEGDFSHSSLSSLVTTPPEQLEDAPELLPISDVYRLGALLYVCLTGKPLFERADAGQLRSAIRYGTPRPPSQVVSQIPVELDRICLKCLEKSPRDRYLNVTALAEDLARFRQSKPIAASTPSASQRLRRWCRNNPLASGFMITLTSLLLLILALVGSYAWKQHEELNRAEGERQALEHFSNQAQANRQRLTQRLNQAKLELVSQRQQQQSLHSQLATSRRATDEARAQANLRTKEAWEMRLAQLRAQEQNYLLQIQLAQHLLRSAPKKAKQILNRTAEPLRGWEHDFLLRQCDRLSLLMWKEDTAIRSLACSPDGSTIVTGSEAGTLRAWDRTSGVNWKSYPGQRRNLRSIRFAPSGTRFVTLSEESTVQIWELTTGNVLHVLPVQKAKVTVVTFAGSDNVLVTAHVDGKIQIHDLKDKREKATLEGHKGTVECLASTANGRTLLSGGADGALRLWDLTSGKQTQMVQASEGAIHAIAISGDGQTLVSGGADHQIRIWNATLTGRPLILRGHSSPIQSLSLSPNQQRLVSLGQDHKARVWETYSRQMLFSLSEETELRCAAFAGSGDTIVTSDDRGRVQRWNASPNHAQTLRPHRDAVTDIALTPNGREIASVGTDDLLILQDIDTGIVSQRYPSPGGKYTHVSFSQDGYRIVLATTTGKVQVWDRYVNEVAGSIPDVPGVSDVTFSPEGTRIAICTRKGLLEIRNPVETKPILHLSDRGPMERIAFSPDGLMLAVVVKEEGAHLLDVTTGRELRKFPAVKGSISSLAFSPDGRQLAFGNTQGQIWIVDVFSGKTQQMIQTPSGAVRELVFAPQNQRLISAGTDGWIRVWNSATHEEMLAFRAGPASIRHLVISRSGGRLVCAGEDGAIQVWTCDRLRPVFRAGIRPQTFFGHPQSSVVVTGAEDRFEVRDARSLEMRSTLPRVPKSITTAVLSRVGTHVMTGDREGVLALWNVASKMKLLSHQAHSEPITALAWPPTGDYLASLSSSGVLKLWQIHDNALTGKTTLKGDAKRISAFAFRIDGKQLACGDETGTIEVCDVTSGKMLHRFAGLGKRITSLAFSADGKRLIVGHVDGKLTVRDAVRGTVIHDLRGHLHPIVQVQVSPNNQWILSRSHPGTTRLWQMGTGEEMLSLPSEGEQIGACFGPESTLLTASRERGVDLWKIAPTLHTILTHPWLTLRSPVETAPVLLVPKPEEILDNGRNDGCDVLHWKFTWTPMRRATHYELIVRRTAESSPRIHLHLQESELDYRSLQSAIASEKRADWTWQVRAWYGERAGEWSEARHFRLLPVNHNDPMDPLAAADEVIAAHLLPHKHRRNQVLHLEELAEAYRQKGTVYWAKREAIAACGAYQEAVRLSRLLVTLDTENPDHRGYLGASLNNWAIALEEVSLTLHKQGNVQEAVKTLKEADRKILQAIQHQKKALEGRPKHKRFLRFLRTHYSALAGVKLTQGQHAEAEELIREMVKVRSKTADELYFAGKLLARCALVGSFDRRLPPPKRKEVVDGYVKQSLEYFQRSIKGGFRIPVDDLKTDQGLILMRSRPEFQEFLRGLQK